MALEGRQKKYFGKSFNNIARACLKMLYSIRRRSCIFKIYCLFNEFTVELVPVQEGQTTLTVIEQNAVAGCVIRIVVDIVSRKQKKMRRLFIK